MPEAAVIYCFSFSVPAEPGFPPFQEVNQVPASPLPQLFSEYLLWLFISFHLPCCECYVVLENKTQIRTVLGKGQEKDVREMGEVSFAQSVSGGKGPTSHLLSSLSSCSKDLSLVACSAPYRTDVEILHMETFLISWEFLQGLHILCPLDTSS